MIQLADRSCAHPKVIVEDVLIRVGEFTYPVDFYVVDMSPDTHAAPIILGRPFLLTAKSQIDVTSGTLTISNGGETRTFDLFGHMKDNVPKKVKDIYAMEVENEAKYYVMVEDESLEDENLLSGSLLSENLSNESLLSNNDDKNKSKPEIFHEVMHETLPNSQELILGEFSTN